jgi:hypothetical protein
MIHSFSVASRVFLSAGFWSYGIWVIRVLSFGFIGYRCWVIGLWVLGLGDGL